MQKLPKLGINIDHVATLRQLRKTPYPDLLQAAQLAQQGGATSITVHLREDRRHIQDSDVLSLKKTLSIPLNLEMAVTDAMVTFARKVKPEAACFVPEKRNEVTTEGGLDVVKHAKKVGRAAEALAGDGIQVSFFIEPSLQAVKQSAKLGAAAVELHVGRYCLATQGAMKSRSRSIAQAELIRIQKAAELGHSLGLAVHAGHGLDYENIKPVAGLTTPAGLPLIEEYNIGHSIVCRAVLVGMIQAVREMAAAIER